MSATGFDLPAYCKRIGYEGPLAPDLRCLRALHGAHARNIPYENFEIHLGRPMSLQVEALQQLMVVESRGGYCFQMNTLFARALEAVGFPLTHLRARVWLTSPADVPPPAHQIMAVSIGSAAWLADVGFGGGGLSQPLPLEGEAESRQGGRRYRLYDAGRFGTMLQRLEAGKWLDLYSFDTAPCYPGDFVHANHFLSTSPQSFFVQNRVCAIATEEGETTLFNQTLRVRRGDELREQKIGDGPAYLAALRAHFGIELPPGTTFQGARG